MIGPFLLAHKAVKSYSNLGASLPLSHSLINYSITSFVIIYSRIISFSSQSYDTKSSAPTALWSLALKTWLKKRPIH
jgi:hypothetical protein